MQISYMFDKNVRLFSVGRQLRVPRVALHRHLFTSLLLNAIAVIAFKGSFLIPATTQGSLITKVCVVFYYLYSF
jgi:hypothetical protein